MLFMVADSQYKLLLLDLDGTTVASRRDALPSARVTEAIKSAQKFVDVSVATGRSHYFAKDIINELGLTGPGVFSGGAEIVQMETGQIINRQLMSVPKMREILKILLPFGHTIFSDIDRYKDHINSVEAINSSVAKIVAIDMTFTDAKNVIDELSGLTGISAHMSTSWNHDDLICVEVTHEKADKKHGVNRLISMLGCKKDQIIAIGDGYNDVPLLEAAGLKIVMGNAPEQIKPLADFVAPQLSEDGLAVSIEKYILS